MKPEETIDFPLRWAWHSLTKYYNKEAQKNGISFTIGYALLNIHPVDGILSSQLAPSLGMEPGSLTRTLKSMEENGLITRNPDKSDKRKVWLYLTSLGKEKRAVARETVVGLNERLFEQLGKRQRNSYVHLMQEINDLLKQENNTDESSNQ